LREEKTELNHGIGIKGTFLFGTRRRAGFLSERKIKGGRKLEKGTCTSAKDVLPAHGTLVISKIRYHRGKETLESHRGKGEGDYPQ